MKKSVDDKTNNIKTEIGKGKISFSQDINVKYERILLQEKRKLDKALRRKRGQSRNTNSRSLIFRR